MIIEFDGIPIEIIKKRVKNMNLRIYPPDGTVKISVPFRFNEQLIRQSLSEKREWIHTHRERIRNRPKMTPTQLQTGSSIPFLGENYLFIVEENQNAPQIQITESIVHCFAPPSSTEADHQRLLDQWYKKQMQNLLPELIVHWETIIGVKVREWGIKKMKSRWGSCNTKAARIWLNLHLIKKPQICLEYVLVHELVHLLEARHNKRFYNFMTQFMPKWREYEHLLEGH